MLHSASGLKNPVCCSVGAAAASSASGRPSNSSTLLYFQERNSDG